VRELELELWKEEDERRLLRGVDGALVALSSAVRNKFKA
jgi:hypothetical protein